MDDSLIARRKFILAALATWGSVATPTACLRGGAAWAETGNIDALARLARRLFPHHGLSDDVYTEVVAGVFSAFAANPGTSHLFAAAESALDAQQDGHWFDADEDTQVQAIENIQGEPFFAAILAAVRGSFYYHPEVWADIDYPGSSKEYGGYVHRGFDDISWLPEVD